MKVGIKKERQGRRKTKHSSTSEAKEEEAEHCKASTFLITMDDVKGEEANR